MRVTSYQSLRGGGRVSSDIEGGAYGYTDEIFVTAGMAMMA